MKLFSNRLEMQAIYNICEGKTKYSSVMLASLSEDHFHSEYSKEIIGRIKRVTQINGEIPNIKEISVDPVISEDSRKAISKFEGDIVDSRRKSLKIVNNLHKYYQMRKLYFLSEKINEALLRDKVDVEKLVNQTAQEISKVSIKIDSQQQMFNLGGNGTFSKVLKKLTNDEKPEMIPTGFSDFDRTNGGLFYGSMVLIGGTTGGGKSSLAIQLLKNMAENAESCVYVPLEMTEVESGARLMSNLSGISLLKILQKKLTRAEKKKVISEGKKFHAKLKKQGNMYSIMSPEEDMTAEEILLMLQPYGFRVILIDYISLLKGVDGEESWKQLSNVARMCKIYAKTHNIIVILLVQINDEGYIRYSKGVEEHANNAWYFVANKETREAGVLNITQKKARNQAMFDFQLAFEADVMRIYDMDKSTASSNESGDTEELSDMSGD